MRPSEFLGGSKTWLLAGSGAQLLAGSEASAASGVWLLAVSEEGLSLSPVRSLRQLELSSFSGPLKALTFTSTLQGPQTSFSHSAQYQRQGPRVA